MTRDRLIAIILEACRTPSPSSGRTGRSTPRARPTVRSPAAGGGLTTGAAGRRTLRDPRTGGRLILPPGRLGRRRR